MNEMLAVETFELTKVFADLFGFKKIVALNDLNLRVNKGEIFGLLGPNGAGKTTLMKILLGITYPTKGEAIILGKKIQNVSVKKRIGYLPENHKYPDYLTGEKVLDFFGKLSGIPASQRHLRIDELLNLVRMNQWRKTRIKKYSKGMLQRLGMAQAMINDPDLLFLDEPTDGVDPIGRREIRDILIDLKKKGKTIFLNSHLLSEVEMICDRVAILNEGELVKYGSVEELTRKSLEFKVKVNNFNQYLSKKLMKETLSFNQNENYLLFSVKNIPQLNKIIDYLRSNQVEIEAIIPQKVSLEDMFIDIIRNNKLQHSRTNLK
ncbi:MAG: ABC transporter ATP-binding protein [Candidatus Aminicenantia bacterium]